jgi:hypothetical protein
MVREISTNNNKMTNLDGLHSNYDIKNNNYDTNRYNESTHSSLETCEQILIIIHWHLQNQYRGRNSIRFENSSGFYLT